MFKDEDYNSYYYIDDPVPKNMFTATKEFIKKQCFRIYNEIENSYYTFDDLKYYMIYRSLWDASVKLDLINVDVIDKFKLLFTEKQLEKDRLSIHEINRQAKLKNIKEYFLIRDNGESLIYRLCMKEIISIYFFMYYADSLLSGYFRKADLKERNKEYKKFNETMKILIDIMKMETFNTKNQQTD